MLSKKKKFSIFRIGFFCKDFPTEGIEGLVGVKYISFVLGLGELVKKEECLLRIADHNIFRIGILWEDFQIMQDCPDRNPAGGFRRIGLGGLSPPVLLCPSARNL